MIFNIAREEHTDILLFQPRQCVQRLTCRILVEDGQVAVTADAARGTPKLDRYDNEAYQPEDKEHESAKHNNGREEATLED